MEEEMGKFDMFSMHLTPLVEENREQLYKMKVPGVIDKYPSVSKGARIVILKGGESYDMTVVKVVGADLILRPDPKETEFSKKLFNDDLSEPILCDIQFVMNRWVIQCMHRALDRLQGHIVKALFPKSKSDISPIRPQIPEIRVYNESIEKNLEQKQAVLNIVLGSSR